VRRTVEACELAREAAAIAAEGIATGSMSHLNAIRQCEKELDAIDVEVDSGRDLDDYRACPRARRGSCWRV